MTGLTGMAAVRDNSNRTYNIASRTPTFVSEYLLCAAPSYYGAVIENVLRLSGLYFELRWNFKSLTKRLRFFVTLRVNRSPKLIFRTILITLNANLATF